MEIDEIMDDVASSSAVTTHVPAKKGYFFLDEASVTPGPPTMVVGGSAGSGHAVSPPTMILDPKNDMPANLNAMVAATTRAGRNNARMFNLVTQSLNQPRSVYDLFDEDTCSYCSEDLPDDPTTASSVTYADGTVSRRRPDDDDGVVRSPLCDDCLDYFDQLAQDYAAVA